MIDHLIQKIGATRVQTSPFSYFFVENIFPDTYYQELLLNIPSPTDYQPLSKGKIVREGTYNQRFCLPLEEGALASLPFPQFLFWSQFSQILKSDLVVAKILHLFQNEFHKRFGDRNIPVFPDLGLISDHSNYSIGPHTDHPQKVLTLLFYFPKDENQKNLGTSLYEPLDSHFHCTGLMHHPFEKFKKIASIPFLPNSVFGFFKSDRSFHGVEPLGEQELPRNLLSYQLLWQDVE
jgi:hypothetical protein